MEYTGYLVSIDVAPQIQFKAKFMFQGDSKLEIFLNEGRKLLIVCSRFSNKIPDYVCTCVNTNFILIYRHRCILTASTVE